MTLTGTIPTPAIPRRTVLRRLATILVVAVIAYAVLWPHVSGDAKLWFVPWLDHIVEHGARHSLAEPLPVLVKEANGLGNYTPPYLYLLAVGSLVHGFVSSLSIVKLVGIAGLAFAAVSVLVLLHSFVPASVAMLGAAGVMLLPAQVLNAAAWGQSDAYYAGFVVLVVAAAIEERPAWMMAAFGAAVSFKLQAIFIGPFLLYMVLSRRIPVWVWLTAPLVYVLMMVPAWLAGRPALDLATIYLDQYHTWPWLSMNSPNPWAFVQWLNLMSQPVGVAVGMSLALVAGLAIAAVAFYRRLADSDLLVLALASAALMPYLLPKMHDRYFFIADLLAFSLAIARPARWTLAVAFLIPLGSFGAVFAHLYGFKIATALGALSIGLALVIVLVNLVRILGLRTPSLPLLD